jgi:hypothetical protein
MPSHAIGNGHSVMRPPRQQQSRLHSLNGIFGTDTHSAGEFVTLLTAFRTLPKAQVLPHEICLSKTTLPALGTKREISPDGRLTNARLVGSEGNAIRLAFLDADNALDYGE